MLSSRTCMPSHWGETSVRSNWEFPSSFSKRTRMHVCGAGVLGWDMGESVHSLTSYPVTREFLTKRLQRSRESRVRLVHSELFFLRKGFFCQGKVGKMSLREKSGKIKKMKLVDKPVGAFKRPSKSVSMIRSFSPYNLVYTILVYNQP